jgi:hypothetical protein
MRGQLGRPSLPGSGLPAAPCLDGPAITLVSAGLILQSKLRTVLAGRR